MILISHRGNIEGKIEEKENHPDYIDRAINLGYDVEIDIRTKNGVLYTGHDYPQYHITIDWLLNRKNNLWIHTKDSESLHKLISSSLKIFFHEKENHTIINNCNIIWTHNLLEVSEKSIIPLLSNEEILTHKIFQNRVYGICSDFIKLINT